jgi:two-component system, cell cycle sensor histidine kinase and response regulator CckA
MPHSEPPDEIVESSTEIGQVLGWLGRSADLAARPVEEILRSITEASARTLRVARVNVWLYDEARLSLECIEAFDARTGLHERGEMLLASEHPSYFRSLDLLRHVSALDVHTDPRTRELDRYLQQHDIATILDVPMLRSGRVFGVVCHEHVGAPRSFRSNDRLFAGSVGDLVALVLETAQRIELERERARMRESMARMAQLDSLGWLAGGVAHDFRNLLMVIGSHNELLQNELLQQSTLGPDNQQYTEAIASAVAAAAALCDQLQAYAGKGTSQQRRSTIAAALADTVRVFQSRVPSNVRFQANIDAALPAAQLDAVALGRAAMNLLVNALEALPPDGGQITLSVRESEPSAIARSRGYDFRTGSGRCGLIEVVDTGVGIPAKLVARVSDPFFTTKARGSGFGLATVLGMVRAHRGVFHVESSEGKGSRFCIWLPLLDG